MRHDALGMTVLRRLFLGAALLLSALLIVVSCVLADWLLANEHRPFRKALLQGGVPEFTCLVGTMVQETYETTPAIREACERSITGHAATLEADIEAAMRVFGECLAGLRSATRAA